MTAAVFEERSDPGQLSSALLSAAMHLVLLAVLVFGVRWQSRPPEAVQVELWEPPAPVAAAEAPKPAPAPVVEPPPAPRPEPVVPKPEIVERKAEKPKPAPKPVAKAEPLKPKVDETKKRMREQLAREEASLAVEHESQMLKDLAARQAASAGSKAQAAWIDKVKAKIRGNIVLPPDIKGNPEAVFDVVQLPTGEVLPPVKLKKSSGIAALDAAIERAVLKSSPLPRPDGGYTAPRDFELKYKPLE